MTPVEEGHFISTSSRKRPSGEESENNAKRAKVTHDVREQNALTHLLDEARRPRTVNAAQGTPHERTAGPQLSPGQGPVGQFGYTPSPWQIRVATLVHGEQSRTPGTTPEKAAAPREHIPLMDGIVEDDENGKPYHCIVDGCEKKYKKLNGLLYHSQVSHSTQPMDLDDPRPYKCIIKGCDRSYKNSNGLAYHIEKNHDACRPPTPVTPKKQPDIEVEKPFTCPYKGCDKAYKNANGLAYHLSKGKATGHNVEGNTGTGVKAYKCAVCSSSFKSPQGLSGHIETAHADMEPISAQTVKASSPTLLKPYKCAVSGCRRSYRTPQGWAGHIIETSHTDMEPMAGHYVDTDSATGLKAYKCAVSGCHQIYANPQAWAAHIIDETSHDQDFATGVRIYKCTACRKQYKTPQGYLGHMESAHPDLDPSTSPDTGVQIQLECPSCMRSFRSQQSLEAHMVTLHNIQQTQQTNAIAGNKTHLSPAEAVAAAHQTSYRRENNRVAAEIAQATTVRRSALQHDKSYDQRQPHHPDHFAVYHSYYLAEEAAHSR
ncbi:uncharacterized protein EV422DRAFT_562792 [Fimicolochytrium jonesii]|uniref:uncharacterized protein n=1 Tax=Fimicolochytrium jonesii TaxID=1396493 RepID=UPI0022FE2272|nr:uncharacterized protein EV422DRAFT_562792 [Fimicolochytrium jonesii]KAI8826739.1 hypothetical protein EV422DRAFT_562792 [Fimicolochytrium jonesii]